MGKPLFLGMICALFLLHSPLPPAAFGHSVQATARADLLLYNEPYAKGGLCGVLPSGTTAEIIEDRSCLWYLVDGGEHGRGWVSGDGLIIPIDTPANPQKLDAAALEGFVNAQGLSSQTDFLLFTDLVRQQTHVFTGEAGKWVLLKTFACSTGRNASPTKRGQFVIEMRGDWFYSQRLGSGARYWMRFDGPYLYHSLAMNADQEIIDHTLGERVSSGCVRLALADAQWLYENVPDKTTVFIS